MDLGTCCVYFVYILFVYIIVCPYVYLVVFVVCFLLYFVLFPFSDVLYLVSVILSCLLSILWRSYTTWMTLYSLECADVSLRIYSLSRFVAGCCIQNKSVYSGGTAAAAPPPFRASDPALCGSCPLVTPYYCRLGDLLCYNCMLYLSSILSVHAYA